MYAVVLCAPRFVFVVVLVVNVVVLLIIFRPYIVVVRVRGTCTYVGIIEKWTAEKL